MRASSGGTITVDWREHVRRCAQRGDAEKYVMPIHTNGDANAVWPRELTGAQCRAFVAGSLFGRAP